MADTKTRCVFIVLLALTGCAWLCPSLPVQHVEVSRRGCLGDLKPPLFPELSEVPDCPPEVLCYDTAMQMAFAGYLRSLKVYLDQVEILCGEEEEPIDG